MSLVSEIVMEKWKEDRNTIVSLTLANAELQEEIAELLKTLDDLSNKQERITGVKLYTPSEIGALCGYDNPEVFNREIEMKGIQSNKLRPYCYHATYWEINPEYKDYIYQMNKYYYKWTEAGKDMLLTLFKKKNKITQGTLGKLRVPSFYLCLHF